MLKRLVTAFTLAMLAVALAIPAPAQARTDISFSGGVLTVAPRDDGVGCEAVVTIEAQNQNYEILDNGCDPVNEIGTNQNNTCDPGGDGTSQVLCARSAITSVVVNTTATNVNDEGGTYAITFAEDPVTFTGSDGPDVLDAGTSGMAEDDVVSGGGDVDNMEGGDGGDVINGGDGNDVLDGGDGDGDTVNGDANSDTLDGGDGNDTVNGGTENDTNVHGGAGIDTVNGGAGADTLDGDAGNDTLNGDAGNDTLRGGQNAVAPQDTDTLNGGADDDDLLNSEGADDFNGGPSNAAGDEVTYEFTTGTAAITADNDDVAGDDGRAGEGDSIDNDVEDLTGDDGVDTLTGNSQANDIDGQEGNDTLRGGPGTGPDGADTLTGGADDDRANFGSRSDDLDLDADGVADDGSTGEGDNVGTTVEDITGGSGDDDITGTASALGAGDDRDLDGGAGDDDLASSTSAAADGADEFTGGSNGTAGGQNGTLGDTVSYLSRDSTSPIDVDIDGVDDDGAGGCPAGAGCEDDDVHTDVENLTGGDGGDVLIGSGSANRILGGDGGSDTLHGGGQAGPDGADIFSGGQNVVGTFDRVTYEARTDGVSADVDDVADDGATGEGDNVGNSIENLSGGAGPDTLVGSNLDNTLVGNAGDDVLRGGTNATNDGEDEFSGGDNGPGGDTVTYAHRTGAIVADIGGGDDDTDLDDVQTTVENLTGGSGGDTLTGSGSPNTLTGGGGGDNLSSLGGADRIEAVDGIADTVDCGTESDVANFDTGLDTVNNCELLNVPPATPPPAGGATIPAASPPSAAPKPKKKCKKAKKRAASSKKKCKRKRR